MNVLYLSPMDDLLDYEDWLRQFGLSESTIAQRMKFARSRAREWGGRVPPTAEITRWLARYDGWTRITYHNHLTSVFAWMIERGRLDADPLARVRRPPSPEPHPKPLDDHEVIAALEAAQGRVWDWIQLGRLAGLRAFEIAKLRGEEVTRRELTFVGKGGQHAIVPTHPEVWEIAQRYPREGWWFPSPQKHREHLTVELIELRVRELFRSVGISGGIHRTRANYGTDLLRAGVNIKVVQKLMRHRRLASTEHYLAVADDEMSRAIGLLQVGARPAEEREAA